jgi:hypothetical protein
MAMDREHSPVSGGNLANPASLEILVAKESQVIIESHSRRATACSIIMHPAKKAAAGG